MDSENGLIFRGVVLVSVSDTITQVSVQPSEIPPASWWRPLVRRILSLPAGKGQTITKGYIFYDFIKKNVRI
jgi:hypothetical protein